MGGGRTNHQKCRGPGTQKAGLLKSPRMMTEARVKGGGWVEYTVFNEWVMERLLVIATKWEKGYVV